MDDFSKRYEAMFDPKVIKQRLILSSLYIALYEIMIDIMIENVKEFYIHDSSQKNHEQYDDEVMGLITKRTERNVQRATILWLVKKKLLCEEDVSKITKFSYTRNKIVHEMAGSIFDMNTEEVLSEYAEMLKFYEKFSHNWLLFLNPDLATKKDMKIFSMTTILHRIMAEIALTGEEKYIGFLQGNVET